MNHHPSSNVARICGLTAMVAGAWLLSSSPVSADSVPYTDPAATGFVGLCDQSDHSIDHGRVDGQPFVWSAVSSVAAPSPYDADGRTATLFAFQPREGLAPSEWSGQLLTASSRYSDVSHPTAVATVADDSLATFIDTFPPQWDGMIELRLFLGAPGEPPLTQQYAATDIQVDGDTWTVVRGGSTPCDSSTAQSIEELVPQGTSPSVVAPNLDAAGPAQGPSAGATTSLHSDGFWTAGRFVAVAALAAISSAFVVLLGRRRHPRGLQ
jgi:hypothetical protein